MDEAHRHRTRLIEGLLAEAARNGDVRDDMAPGELAAYCLHALAGSSPSPWPGCARHAERGGRRGRGYRTVKVPAIPSRVWPGDGHRYW